MKVIIGLSGGVDSSVAAYLLQQQGYEVEGLFMINWHDTEGTLSGSCPWEDDIIIAEIVAKKLGFPLHTVDFSKEYRKRIVDYMFSEYEKGRTPNPDVLCNREIKFDLFLDKAMELGAEMIATGHYCQKDELFYNGKKIYRLLAGKDQNKDQSYFLCQLNQQQLAKTLFPIGHLQKPEVRKMADQLNLATSQRKDSQGICFVGKVDLPGFLQQKLEPKEGVVIEIPSENVSLNNSFDPDKLNNLNTKDLQELCSPYKLNPDSGIPIGKHRGAHFFTIGQRKGINIGGKKEPLFVVGIDVENNILYVGQGEKHPYLLRRGLFIQHDDIHWLRKDQSLQPGESREYQVRVRYRQPLQNAILLQKAEGLYIIFKTLQRSITPGQFAAWYLKDELFGSGVIS